MTRRRALMGKVNCPYITNGLIFWLDGIIKGNDSSKWTDLIHGIMFDLTNATFEQTGVNFGTNGYGFYEGMVSTDYLHETIEIACSGCDSQNAIFYPMSENGSGTVGIGCVQGASGHTGFYIHGNSGGSHKFVNASANWKTISINENNAVRNKTNVSFGSTDYWGNAPDGTYIAKRPYANEYHFNGTIYSIRIYNRHLTSEEMKANQTVDYQRFSL